MPVLAQETYLYPNNLLEETPSSARDGWWVLHTRPRAEKSLARRLLGLGARYFLPQHRHRWRSKGRNFESHLPLFPSYLFLFGDAEARHLALTTNLIVSTLVVEDQKRLHDDLIRVHQLMLSGAPLISEERLTPGAPVEVVKGPLAGMQGTIIRRGNGWRFFVEVSLLRCGVSVEMEGWMIQPIAAGLQASA